MYIRKIQVKLLILLALIPLCGCATIQQDKVAKPGTESLETRLALLEAQIINKDIEIKNLTQALEKARETNTRLLKSFAVQDEVNMDSQDVQSQAGLITQSKNYYYYIMAIQLALRNAGYDIGFVDGKMGKRTRDAIKEFQQQNSLPANSMVDKQTWDLLVKYLDVQG